MLCFHFQESTSGDPDLMDIDLPLDNVSVSSMVGNDSRPSSSFQQEDLDASLLNRLLDTNTTVSIDKDAITQGSNLETFLATLWEKQTERQESRSSHKRKASTDLVDSTDMETEPTTSTSQPSRLSQQNVLLTQLLSKKAAKENVVNTGQVNPGATPQSALPKNLSDKIMEPLIPMDKIKADERPLDSDSRTEGGAAMPNAWDNPRTNPNSPFPGNTKENGGSNDKTKGNMKMNVGGGGGNNVSVTNNGGNSGNSNNTVAGLLSANQGTPSGQQGPPGSANQQQQQQQQGGPGGNNSSNSGATTSSNQFDSLQQLLSDSAAGGNGGGDSGVSDPLLQLALQTAADLQNDFGATSGTGGNNGPSNLPNLDHPMTDDTILLSQLEQVILIIHIIKHLS